MSDWTDTAEAELRRQMRTRRLGDRLAEELLDLVTPIIGAPRDARAWGRVIRKLAGEGLLIRVGFRPARSSNGSAKPVWRAA
jgi:hypothetical protein